MNAECYTVDVGRKQLSGYNYLYAKYQICHLILDMGIGIEFFQTTFCKCYLDSKVVGMTFIVNKYPHNELLTGMNLSLLRTSEAIMT